MNFECEILDKLNMVLVAKTPPSIEIDNSQAILLKLKVKFSDAKKYSDKQISTSTLWRLIEFYTPAGLSNLLQTEDRIEFPMSTGIVGE